MVKINIIGISGLPRSGKDTLAEIFIKEGHYYGVSLGDIVRDAARVRHAPEPDPISVANMTETANWLRGNRGPDFALNQALKLFDEVKNKDDSYQGLVVYSVRAPVEVDFILGHGGRLIWVEASDEVRYGRAMDDLRQGEAKVTLEEFKAQEDLQWHPQPGIPSFAQMNISYVKSKATNILENNTSDVSNFHLAARKLLTTLSQE